MADERERCPKCGALPVEPGAYTYDWACKSSKKISGYVEESALCLRRQLAQARERERAALAREAWLRRVAEDAQSAPQRAQEWMRANGVQVADPSVPMQRAVFEVYNLLVELAQQAEAALADTPAPSDRPNIQNRTHLEALQTGAGVGMTNYTSEGQTWPHRASCGPTRVFGEEVRGCDS